MGFFQALSLLSLLSLRVSCLSMKQNALQVRGGWTALGCYTDNVSGRTLTYGAAVAGGASAMTVELCQSTCQGLGYILAGVEYADECCMYTISYTRLSLTESLFSLQL